MSTKSEQASIFLDNVKVPTKISGQLDETINQAFDTYYAKSGGIKVLQDKLAAAETPFKSALNKGMMIAAEDCVKEAGGKNDEALALFLAACHQSEYRLKIRAEKAGMTNTSIIAVLPAWSPTKTAVKAFLESGRDIFATESVKVDGKDVEKRLYTSIEKLRNTNQQDRKPGGTVAGKTPAGKPMTFVGGTDALKTVLAAMFKELALCTQEEQNEAAGMLMEVLATIQNGRKAHAKRTQAETDALISGERIVGQGAAVEASAGVLAASANKEHARRGGSRR